MSVRLLINGEPDSAWAAELRALAAGRVDLVFQPADERRGSTWDRLLKKALPYASGRGAATASLAPGPATEQWQFEDGEGRPLFSPFFAASAWQRAPYCMALRLVAERAGARLLLAEAWVGTRDSYPDLLQQLALTARVVLEKALSSSPPDAIPVGAAVRGLSEPVSPLALVGGALRQYWQRNARRLAVETWAVGIVERPVGQVLGSGELGDVFWLTLDDREGYLADPFPWPGRADWILCERYSNRSCVGDLVAIEGRDTGHPVHIDIPEKRHLSYPGAWLEDTELLLMPESGAARRTVIYRLDKQARAVPWITVADEVGMADPTLFRRDGLYWIAYTDTDIGLHDNLCLLFAEQLQGPWRRHPGNPVKLDIRSSRPGGPLFQWGEEWFRPAQDCAADYGAALAINRIVELSPTRFREEVVAVLRPDRRGPYPDGLHTLSVWGDRLLIDGKRWRRGPRVLVDKIRKRLLRTGDS